MYIGKEKDKISLFVDDMMLYIRDTKISTRIHQEMIKETQQFERM